jgi:hypothetical protein
MQLKLGFLKAIDPTVPLWDEIDPKAKEEFLHALARAIAKAISREPNLEEKEDRHDR